MSKEQLLLWNRGNDYYKAGNLSAAIETLSLADCAKSAFNIGMVYSRIGDHENADFAYELVLNKHDSYMAVSYLQKGFSLFMLRNYQLAYNCYNVCIDLLLSNDFIDYEQLGLKFKLFRCEVIYNMGTCLESMGDRELAFKFFEQAKQMSRTDVQRSITFGSSSTSFNLFTVPIDCIFEVPAAKLKNIDKKTYLKDGLLVLNLAHSGSETTYSGFTGALMIDPTLEHDTTLARKISLPVVSMSEKSSTLSRSFSTGGQLLERPGFLNPPELPNSKTIPRTSPSVNSKLIRNGSLEVPVKKAMASRKSSLLSNRSMPSTPTSKSEVIPSSRYPFIDEDVWRQGTQEKITPQFSKQTVNPEGLEDITVKLHSAEGTVSMISYADISLSEFVEDVLLALHLDRLSSAICFTEEQDTSIMIQILVQEDLKIALSGQKLVHLYITAPDLDLLDLY